MSPPPNPPAEPRRSVWPAILLAAYLLALALLTTGKMQAINRLAGLTVRVLADDFPWLTFNRLEFGMNVIVFIPVGFLLSLALSRSHRYLVMPVAFLITVGVESVQAAFLPQRVPSVLDIISNTTGACIGLVLAAIVAERMARVQRRRTQPMGWTTPPQG